MQCAGCLAWPAACACLIVCLHLPRKGSKPNGGPGPDRQRGSGSSYRAALAQTSCVLRADTHMLCDKHTWCEARLWAGGLGGLLVVCDGGAAATRLVVELGFCLAAGRKVHGCGCICAAHATW